MEKSIEMENSNTSRLRNQLVDPAEQDLLKRAHKRERALALRRLDIASSNITEAFERLYEWPRHKLPKTCFSLEDENYARFTFSGEEYSFSWYPRLIVLSSRILLWNRGTVSYFGSVDEEMLKETAHFVLESLSLVPLQDEDCPSIQVYNEGGFTKGIFYFNHEFPGGWNENHVIPLK